MSQILVQVAHEHVLEVTVRNLVINVIRNETFETQFVIIHLQTIQTELQISVLRVVNLKNTTGNLAKKCVLSSALACKFNLIGCVLNKIKGGRS